MNAPAKRFSLQRLLTTPAPMPAPEPVVVRMPDPVPAPPAPAFVAPPPPVPVPPPLATALVEEFAPLRAVPPARLSRTAPEEPSHPKKKRSYSVDMKLCEDLEILSWYQSRSSSSVVEELIRKHLQHNKSLVLKARDIRSAR